MTDQPQPDGLRTPAPPLPPTGGYPPAPVPPASYPAYQAPAGAYQVPVGGYAAPTGGYAAPEAPQRRSSALGILALLLALIVAVVLPIIAGFSAWAIGYGIPDSASDLSTQDFDSLAFLSPVRDQVFWTELTFWAATILGVAAIVIGIVAIVKRRGRAQGIAGLVIAVVAPAIYFTVAFVALGFGATAGAVALYSS